MGVLNRKLLRDLWRLRGQVLAIALVVASGVAVLVMSLTSIEALEETASAYYERYRFAQVFAGVKRAPEKLARRIAEIPGVQTVETRIVKLATLDIAGFEQPAIGQLISIPERGQSVLNRLVLRAGRRVALGRADEVVLSEPFAEAHGLRPGDHLAAILNGRKRRLEIVGIALSPEYVYAIGPGQLMPADNEIREVLVDYAGDPVAEEIMRFITDLNEDEQIDLVALLWLGRDGSSAEDWTALRAEAARAHNEHTADYLMGTPLLGDYLSEGLGCLGYSCEEYELQHQ
jgi:hypothetical protein